LSGRNGDLVFVGDVHLDGEGPAVAAFTDFLEAISPTTSRLVLAGDLFNIWIGRRELEQSHHHAVLAKLRDLRRRGIVVRYLEGNRDYRVGRLHAGSPLDDASETGIVERFGGMSLFAIHGDMVNEADRWYRIWRRVSRTGASWVLFHTLPAHVRLRIADAVERKLRGGNLGYKREFPEAAVRRYAAERLRLGHDVVVLGHFHVEKDLEAEPPSPPGRILVLPEWKGSRRHLRVGADGDIAFVDSGS
jgi:UDP-2,3-diacylglucosamine pyrophosphatase LpxH